MKAKNIIDLLDRFAPKFLIDSWDNTGFQIGNQDREVRKILVSLDVDKRVLDHCIKNDIDMIISHHPVIFSPLKDITNKTPKGDLIYRLIREDIVVYNAHTNLDQTIGGVNDVLADLFKLKDVEVLRENLEVDDIIYGYGNIGRINDVKLLDYIDVIKDILEIDRLTVFGDTDKLIKRLAVCGGSGAEFIKDAIEKEADLYITGDIKYHDAQEAIDSGLAIIDAGHFHTEKIILPKIKEIIEKEFAEEVSVILYKESSPIYKIY